MTTQEVDENIEKLQSKNAEDFIEVNVFYTLPSQSFFSEAGKRMHLSRKWEWVCPFLLRYKKKDATVKSPLKKKHPQEKKKSHYPKVSGLSFVFA